MLCPHCGKSVDAQTASCPHCGKELAEDAFSPLWEAVYPPPSDALSSPKSASSASSPFQCPSQVSLSSSPSASPRPAKKTGLFLALAGMTLAALGAALFFSLNPSISPEEQRQRVSQLNVENCAWLSLPQLEDLIGPLTSVSLPEGVTAGEAYIPSAVPAVTFILGDLGVEQVAIQLEQPLPYSAFLSMVSIPRDAGDEGSWLELTRDAALISGVSEQVSQLVLTFEQPVYSLSQLSQAEVQSYRIVLSDQIAGFHPQNPPRPASYRMDPALIPESEVLSDGVLRGELRNLQGEEAAQTVIFYQWIYWESDYRRGSLLLSAQVGSIPPGETRPYAIEIPSPEDGISLAVCGTAGWWR